VFDFFDRYTEDKVWYRAKILEVGNDPSWVKVSYVDYGNEEFLPTSELRTIPATFMRLPPLSMDVFEQIFILGQKMKI
jgi:hypothetical protein